ncbi:MAG TPA: Crp/Fnr family transcriptional regulator [Terriglobales bacterium]|nr:Crp/Fnr family transcriptional regulator [Terriglobales bacterium]
MNYTVVNGQNTATNTNVNELYAPLPAEIRHKLERHEQIKTVPAGTRLISQGIAQAYLFIINSGSVELSVPSLGRSIKVAVAGSGKVFGLHAMVSGEPPKVNVTCLEECAVTLIPKEKFTEILQGNPQIYFAIAKILSQDLRIADDLLRRIPRNSGPGRRFKNDKVN